MNIINKKQTLLSSLILKLFLFLFLFSYNCCQTLLSANENQNNLSKEHASHISFLKFKYNLLPEELKKLIVIIDVEPYHIYQDQEGNVIREYKFFHDMQKNKKDINYKTNFFPIKSFQEKVSKLNNNYPIIWTNGKENLSNFQKDIKENLIYKDLFPISKSDYYFIQTDEPQADLSLLLNDRDIENKQEIIKFNNETYGVYFNKNNSVLNQTDPIDLNDLIINNDVQYRTPYIRLLTKNLELEFNYLALISKNFSNYLNENIVNNIENIFKAEKSIDTYKKYHRILQEMKKEIKNI